jgi:hypothetical protein
MANDSATQVCADKPVTSLVRKPQQPAPAFRLKRNAPGALEQRGADLLAAVLENESRPPALYELHKSSPIQNKPPWPTQRH